MGRRDPRAPVCVGRVALAERNAASSPLPVGRVAVREQNAAFLAASNATRVAQAEQNRRRPSRVVRVALGEQNAGHRPAEARTVRPGRHGRHERRP
jgi:hypothetical protein